MKKFLSPLLLLIILSQFLFAQTAFAGGSVLYSIPKDILYFFRIGTYNSHPLGHKVEDYLNDLFYHDAVARLFDERTFANIFVVAQGPNPDDPSKLTTYHIFKIPEQRFNNYLDDLPVGSIKVHHIMTFTYYSLGNFFFGAPYKTDDSGQLMIFTADNSEALLNMMDQTESVMDSEKIAGMDWSLEAGFFEGYLDYDAIRAFDAENAFALQNLSSGGFYLEGDYRSASGSLNLLAESAIKKHMEFNTDFLDKFNLENLLLYPKNDSSENGFDKIFNLKDTSPDQAGGGINEVTLNGKNYLYYHNPASHEWNNPMPFGCQSLPVYDINSLFGQPADFTFKDVNEKSPYHAAIQTLLQKGLIEGYQTDDGRYFYPEKTITRAEFTKLALAAQVKEVGGYGDIGPQLYFFDVSPCEWFAPYINKAFTFGFIKGHPDGTFKPHDRITRAEAIQEFYYANYELRTESGLQKEPPYTDVTPDDWYYDAVKAAYNHGLLDNSARFNPSGYFTRGETAKLLAVFFNRAV